MRDVLNKQSKTMTTDLSKQGEYLHREIDIIIQSLQHEIVGTEATHQSFLDRKEKERNSTIDEISQLIMNLKRLIDSSNVSLVSKYESRNEKFRILPANLKITFSNYQRSNIDQTKLLEQIGILPFLSIHEEIQDNKDNNVVGVPFLGETTARYSSYGC